VTVGKGLTKRRRDGRWVTNWFQLGHCALLHNLVVGADNGQST